MRRALFSILSLAIFALVACEASEVVTEQSALALATTVTSPAPKPSSTITTAYSLELLAVNGSIEYGYFTVQGQVKNISDAALENVMVQATLYEEDGITFAKSCDALVDLNPILPGETTTFKALTDWNQDGGEFQVTFRYLLGASIPFKDSR